MIQLTDNTTGKNQHKQALFESSLFLGTVMVFVTKGPNVIVPDSAFGALPADAPPGAFTFTALDYGLSMAKDIPDLKTDGEGIRATLSFDNVPTNTFVPWENVFMMRVKGAGFACSWTPDAGTEELAQKPSRPSRPKLTLVQ